MVAEENLTKEQMHSASTAIIGREEARVASLLGPFRRTLEDLARILVEKETVTGQELRAMLPEQARAS
ncbi:MAG: hypothetical protein H5T99_08270 [Moorella sp. (in: Bacteria)]|nr:hypothetical protein [Moorella sp. (in: firmicutes)]